MKLMKLVALGFGLGLVSLPIVGCKSEEPAQQGGYPQQSQPAGVGQPPAQAGYGQPGAAPAAAPAAAPGAVPAAAPAAALSPPGPLALPCSSDAQCGTAHCNVAAGHCVFPCQNDNDCIAPNHCMATLCVPPMPGQ